MDTTKRFKGVGKQIQRLFFENKEIKETVKTMKMVVDSHQSLIQAMARVVMMNHECMKRMSQNMSTEETEPGIIEGSPADEDLNTIKGIDECV